MRGMALLPGSAPIDQSQNFPADYHMHRDEPACASTPARAGLPVRYRSRSPIRSILRMSPKWGDLHEFSAVGFLANRTASSICQWWYSHHLVVLYHLNCQLAMGDGSLSLQ